MKTYQRKEEEISQEVERIHKEIQPALYEFNPMANELFKVSRKKLAEKIGEIETMITIYYPELSVHIEDKPSSQWASEAEMQKYFDDLNRLVNKFLEDQLDYAFVNGY